MNEIRQLIEAKQYDQAELELKALLAKDSENVLARELYGILEFSKKNYSAAKALLEDVFRKNSQSETAAYYLGIIYGKEGLVDKGIFYLEKSLQANPRLDAAHSLLEELRNKQSQRKAGKEPLNRPEVESPYGSVVYQWNATKTSSRIYYFWSIIYALVPLSLLLLYIVKPEPKSQIEQNVNPVPHTQTSTREDSIETAMDNLQAQMSQGSGNTSAMVRELDKLSRLLYTERKNRLAQEQAIALRNQTEDAENSKLFGIPMFFLGLLSVLAIPRAISNLIAGYFSPSIKYTIYENGLEIQYNGINKKIVRKYMHEISSVEAVSPYPLSLTDDWVLKIPYTMDEQPSLDDASVIRPWGGSKSRSIFITRSQLDTFIDFIAWNSLIDREKYWKSNSR